MTEDGVGETPRLDARGAYGFQVGSNNTQTNFIYVDPLTHSDGVGRPAMVDVRSGSASSPYRGLGAYEEADAGFFCGREAATDEVLRRLDECARGPNLMVLSGVSGAGKSSLVKAGVLPRIRGAGLPGVPGAARWTCVVFTPTASPLVRLAEGIGPLARLEPGPLARNLAAVPTDLAATVRQAVAAQRTTDAATAGPDRLLLVVDQFEQLFTQCADDRARRAFLTALHAAATGGGPGEPPAALVVLVVRADLEARCADHAELRTAVQRRYLVTGMDEEELRAAITEPARRHGSSVEPALVDRLLREVRHAPAAGALPLLSYALDQAWRHRSGSTLTMADYLATGGIRTAVARSAQAVYDGLDDAQRAEVPRTFVALTATAEDGTDSARRVPLAELTAGRSPEEARSVRAVVNAFAAERLLTLGNGTVEISHEALLTAWPLLDGWLARTRADRAVRTVLRSAAEAWSARKDSAFLYRGSRLEVAAEAVARIRAEPDRHPALADPELRFLAASSRAQRHAARLRTAVVVALCALVVALSTATVVAVSSQRTAVRSGDLATSRQLAVESVALGETSPEVSALASLAAWRTAHTDEARAAMLTAAARPVSTVLADQSSAVAFGPHGLLVVATSTGTLLWDSVKHRRLGSIAYTRRNLYTVAVSPDGRTVAVGGDSTGVMLWDITNPARPTRIGSPLAPALVSVLVFDPHRNRLAAGGENGVTVWDLTDRDDATQYGRLPATTDRSDTVSAVAFDPTGTVLAVGDDTGTTRWNLPPDGRPSQRGPALRDARGVAWVASSPDGRTLATGDGTGTDLWDLTADPPRSTRLASATGPAAFNRDGTLLAAATATGTALWDVTTFPDDPQRTAIATIADAAAEAVAFGPDGTSLATVDDNGAVRVHQIDALLGRTVTSDTTGDATAAYSPDGRWLATATGQAGLTLHDTRRNLAGSKVGPWNSSSTIAFDSTGSLMAGGGRVWTVPRSGAPTSTLLAGPTPKVALNRAGTMLATGVETTRLWHVARPGRTLTRAGHDLDDRYAVAADDWYVSALAFNPAGTVLAAADRATTVLWDTRHRTMLAHLPGTYDTKSVAFSPDGTVLATASTGGTALWDVRRPEHPSRIVALPGTAGSSAVTVSPDGRTLAVGAADGTTLWDTATHQRIATLPSADSADGVSFAPDGASLAVTTNRPDSRDGEDGRSRVTVLDVGYLVHPERLLCRRYGGTVTPAQWRSQFPHGPGFPKVC